MNFTLELDPRRGVAKYADERPIIKWRHLTLAMVYQKQTVRPTAEHETIVSPPLSFHLNHDLT